MHDGLDQLIERGTILRVAAVGGQRDVDVRAFAVALAGLTRRTCARVEREQVRRDVEQIAVFVEGVLRAVAVVNVDVDDGDAFQPVALAGGLGRDRDVVEQAKTFYQLRPSVVAGWGPNI